MNQTIRKAWRVNGRVQGVGFRAWVAGIARDLGISGYTCNHADGSVEVRACGSADAMQRFEQYLSQGPPAAVVARVHVIDDDAGEMYDGFVIRRSK